MMLVHRECRQWHNAAGSLRCGALPPQVAVYEMSASKVGGARYDFVAGVETVDTAGVEAAAGRDVRGARDVALEQDVLFFHRGVRDWDVCKQCLGVRVRRVAV